MENKSEYVYSEIKRMIIEGEMEPLTDISEESLREKFATSRTPIREAILRLEKEGFVYIYPRKGTLVSAISMDVLNQVYELRLMMEPILVRNACKNLTDQQIDELYHKVEEGPTDASSPEYRLHYIKLDQELHNLILQATNNRFIQQAMLQAYDHNHRARIKAAEHNEAFEKAKQQHLELLKALKERDEEVAVDVIRRHVIEGRNNFSHFEFVL